MQGAPPDASKIENDNQPLRSYKNIKFVQSSIPYSLGEAAAFAAPKHILVSHPG